MLSDEVRTRSESRRRPQAGDGPPKALRSSEARPQATSSLAPFRKKPPIVFGGFFMLSDEVRTRSESRRRPQAGDGPPKALRARLVGNPGVRFDPIQFSRGEITPKLQCFGPTDLR